MTASTRLQSPAVLVDPADAQKPSQAFFAEKPWDGASELDPAELSAARFFLLVCGEGEDPEGA